MNNKVEQLINNIERSIIGKRPVIEKVVCAMLAGGHVLIEDAVSYTHLTLPTKA